ncbi:MAG: hypothetical protein GF398_09370 [Chitinivibrionales bacterium]|nr:hypothetical protein [Chitinivibrionales bacterium]
MSTTEKLPATPLELYEKAYSLQYRQDSENEAFRYYQHLIEQFPESPEAGYAMMHINKIKSKDIVRAIRKSKITFNWIPLSVSAVVLLVALVSSGYHIAATRRIDSFIASLNTSLAQYATFEQETHNNIKKLEYIAQALAQLQLGKRQSALDILAKAKAVATQDATPHIISADIYLASGQVDAALDEYYQMQQRFPDLASIGNRIEHLKQQMSDAGPKADDPQTEQQQSSAISSAENASRTSFDETIDRSKELKKPREYDQSLLVVDSVDFF